MMTPNELFSLLSDETRLRCLMLLQKEGELCVCEISQIMGSIQPKISRHLALMRQSGLVSDERRGQWVYYSINSSLPDWAKRIIESSWTNLRKKEPYKSDIKKIDLLKQEDICKNKCN
jgi:ArsR family transcriptional regulator